MKQTDIAMIILIAAISLVASYFIGNAVINSPDSRSTEVEIAIPISEEFPEPSKKIFNDNSINPTEKIEIGEANKDKPFNN